MSTLKKLHAMVLADYDWLRALEKMVIMSAPAAQGHGATLNSVGGNYFTKAKTERREIKRAREKLTKCHW